MDILLKQYSCAVGLMQVTGDLCHNELVAVVMMSTILCLPERAIMPRYLSRTCTYRCPGYTRK